MSFWQLEGDPSFPGHTFSGFGRFALFQILGSTPRVRVVLDLTMSPTNPPSGSYSLPPAGVFGADRVRFPVVGSGSARVVSPPLTPRIIDGQPYLVLDMGKRGAFPVVSRPGVTGIWGKSVVLDPRFLTSYVRDVSLVSNAEYDRLAAPSTIQSIPADLANPNLEYSGIFEDGWVGRESYAQLSGGPSGRLMIRADVLARPAGPATAGPREREDARIPAGGTGIARSRPPATGLLRPAEDRASLGRSDPARSPRSAECGSSAHIPQRWLTAQGRPG